MVIKNSLRRVLKVAFPDDHFVSMLKWELKLALVHSYARLSLVQRNKLRKVKSKHDLKINVGNGPFKHEGWVNLDCSFTSDRNSLVFDLRRQWPIRSQSARLIFSEHVFEHFSYPEDIRHVLSECYRVLQKDGMLRVIVPDAERYVKAYYEKDEDFLFRMSNGSKSRIEAVNRVFRENGFHKYAYDFEAMKGLLIGAGFSEVRPSSFRTSECAELNLDLDEVERRLESLYIEAVR